MDSNKLTVRIGHTYEDAFQSICALVNGKCIDKSVILSCENDSVIETDQYIFEYCPDLETIDTGSEIGMSPEGATWFKGVREHNGDNAMGMWLNLLELVATNYHKEYSLVEYIDDAASRTKEEIDKYKELIRRVVTGLNYSVSEVAAATQLDSTEDIYALSIRVELFVGVGEPKPLLCKLYFRSRNHRLIPIHKDEAKAMDTYIGSVVSSGRKSSGQSVKTETETVDNVLNTLEKLIRGELASDFADCMVITNETDEESFKTLSETGLDDEVQFECRKLKVLGISHAQWVEPAFYVYVENQKAFLAKIDADGNLSMNCCCNDPDNALIERNAILYHSEETGKTDKIPLDITRDNLGLTDEQMDLIHDHTNFANHFFPINCVEVQRRGGINCKKYICKSSALDFVVDGKTCYKCADCPYPEVVYYDPSGVAHYTPSLNFDSETLTVVRGEVETCRFCKRTYAKESMDQNFYCKFCASAIDEARAKSVAPANKKAYKAYSGMLPLTLRMSNTFNRKVCFENGDRLIFFVGKKKFFFDKLNLTESGKIKAPEKR